MEKAIIAALNMGKYPDLSELERLVMSAGGEVASKIIQKRGRPHPAYYVGKGKAGEIAQECLRLSIQLVIFNGELTPVQKINLEEIIQAKVIDRTGLILDIFASRARTSEGKLQVELAQLMHILPTLTGHGVMFSQLGAGIGTRGPGETKLEYDRRRIRKRIQILQKDIQAVTKSRQIQKEGRSHYLKGHPTVSLIGYTNAGKSTLMNALSGSEVLVDDRLFATLDPTTRKVEIGNNQELLVTDTVGFIKELPHTLVAAFRSTLEEVCDADLLLHVVDVSSERMNEEIDAVNKVLKDLKADKKPILIVFNKKDKAKKAILKKVLEEIPMSAAISALNKDGINDLLGMLSGFFSKKRIFLKLKLPVSDAMKILNVIYKNGEVLKKEYEGQSVIIEANVDEEAAHNIKYSIKQKGG